MTESNLANNFIIFGRLLRRLGLGAQPDRIILFARAVEAIGFGSRADVKAAGRSIFVRTSDDRVRYDRAFDAFWSQMSARADTASQPGHEEPTDRARDQAQDEPQRLETGRPIAPRAPALAPAVDQLLEGHLVPEGDRSFTYSFAEALSERDFSQLSPSELELAHELAKHKHLELGMRESRRTQPGQDGAFDPRRTFRSALRQYGEMVTLRRRTPRLRQRDIVLLCDISGSMDRYSRLLLQFIHAMRHSLGNVEAFVFATRLTRITRQIRQRDVNQALNSVTASVADWGGGTRIGECLREFNVKWARRVLARGAIVIIISDGWDRGDIGLLAREMQRLQRSSYRLIWLNPLLGARSYRPQTIGMRAALPFIDDFLPAHNLKSLVQLVLALRSIDRRRPVRRQVRELEAVS